MSMTIGLVEVGPGYGVNGYDDVTLVGGMGAYDDVTLVGGGMGMVDIGPGYVVNGAGMGAYDDVTLVGNFGLAETGVWSKTMIIGVVVGGFATAASAYLLGKSLAYNR